MEFRLRAAKVGSTGELGGLGYVVTLLQIGGFAVGGFAVYGYLVLKPYCEKCSRYLKKTGQQERFTSNGKALTENIRDFASLLDNRQFDDAIRLHAQEMGVDASPGHHLRTRLIIRECSRCGVNHLEFFASKLDGDNWKDISETEMRMFVNAKLATAAASPVRREYHSTRTEARQCPLCGVQNQAPLHRCERCGYDFSQEEP